MIDTDTVIKELHDLKESGYRSDFQLRHAVKAIAEADERFGWVGVYLLNEDAKELWLHNYVGPTTQHGRIPVGEGVCGTAVAEGKNQNIADVTAIENYLACSPTVKSELVVLIRAGAQIFGQIDIDSDEAAAFTDEDEAAIQVIADKLAEQLAYERA